MAQGEFISPEHFNPNGSPQNARILWADDKQLEELSLAVTRKEEASDEEESLFRFSQIQSPLFFPWNSGDFFLFGVFHRLFCL